MFNLFRNKKDKSEDSVNLKNWVTCDECGETYDNSGSEDPEFHYCDTCQEFLGNIGKAIDMVNGDEDYDDDFVERNL